MEKKDAGRGEGQRYRVLRRFRGERSVRAMLVGLVAVHLRQARDGR